jgi:hypothetical protein
VNQTTLAAQELPASPAAAARSPERSSALNSDDLPKSSPSTETP